MASFGGSETERSNRRYIATTMRAPLLERGHEAKLARRWLKKRDSAALHELIESHGRLVVRIASGFRSSGLPLADLIQEGNIGVMEAAERFDPSRDVRFSTYASWWIMASIQNYILRNSSIVRAATTPKQRRLFFNLRRLRAKFGTGPDGSLTTDDRVAIAAKLDVTVADVERMEMHLARPDQSLNAPLAQDETAEIQDLLADTAPTPDDIVENESAARARNEWLEKALGSLSARERQIIESRFLDDRKLTLAEIGEEFGVSKERIRQIENRALEKMHAVLAEFPGRPQDFFAH
ncbi:MAG: RNA polymerase factor sigma-32 [Alphaproteobacteria bacterium]